YPWIFNEIKHFIKTGELLAPPTITDRVNVVKKHLEFSVKWKNDVVGIFEMRPHYSQYFKGIANFKEYRMKLVTAHTKQDVLEVLEEVQDAFDGYMN
ncbi:MAG: tRNA-dihydrouridine synthase, partial [Bacteroidetes bacterium]|nr:tRNA-dihydrouridine synthase [Bacteroidota bacterium]